MTTVKDEWITAAMTDDRVVVELLIRLKQAQSTPQAVVPLRWGLRLPRSRPSTSVSLRCDKKDGEFPARCSPTTPLSWSGGGGGGAASPSAADDGFEEMSRHRNSRSPPGVRSKGTINTESTSNATASKRSRRKKTFAELKEEEDLLMKESMHLRKEIEHLNATYKEQTARNDNLKRMKVDLNLQYVKLSDFSEEAKEICSQPNNKNSSSCDTHGGVSNHDRSFLLPDLNSMPFEEDLAPETR